MLRGSRGDGGPCGAALGAEGLMEVGDTSRLVGLGEVPVRSEGWGLRSVAVVSWVGGVGAGPVSVCRRGGRSGSCRAAL